MAERKHGTISDLITWLVMTNRNVVINNNRTIQKTYTFTGKDSYNMTEDEQERYIKSINNALKRLKSGYMLFFEAQKQVDYQYMDRISEEGLEGEFDKIRRDKLTGDKNFIIRYFLTFVYKQPSELMQRVEKVLDKDNKTVAKEFMNAVKEFANIFNPRASIDTLEDNTEEYIDGLNAVENDFIDTVEDIILMLKRHFIDIRPLDAQETLTYLHSTISEVRHPIKSPIRSFITQELSDSTFLTGRVPKLGSSYIGIIGVKDLPSVAHPFMFDKLNSLKSEYRLCTRYLALSKEDAKKEIITIQNQHKQRAKSFITMVIEAVSNKVSDKVDESALLDEQEAKQASIELEQDSVGYGYMTTNVVLLNKDRALLEKELSEVKSLLNDMGFVAVLEKDNAPSAWLSTIPSCYEFNVRRYLVHSLTLAASSPISAMWEGEKKNKHFENLGLSDAALMKCKTFEGLPFYLNLHVEDTGHTFIAGMTGTGKSVLLNTIACNFQKYQDAKVFIFDKSASSRVLTQAMGGNFYNLLVDMDTISFQPLANIHDDIEKIWVLEWLCRYAESQNIILSPEDKQALRTALRTIATYEPRLRTMTSLMTTIQNETWRLILSTLQGSDGKGGTYGQLFDSEVDKFGEGNWQVFEMEKIMENENIVAPTLDYLFHRIESQLTGAPTLIILDECWLFLRNAAFRKKIVEYLKDLRKKNASVVMATQNLTDVTDELLPVIVENMPSKIFLANEAMNTMSQKMYELFGLNAREIEIVKNLIPKKEYFYRSVEGGRIFDLNLSSLEAAFLTATSKIDQKKAAEYKHLPPDEFTAAWKEYKSA